MDHIVFHEQFFRKICCKKTKQQSKPTLSEEVLDNKRFLLKKKMHSIIFKSNIQIQSYKISVSIKTKLFNNSFKDNSIDTIIKKK